MDKKSDIGLIGLGVMGKNLALNMEDKGFRVSVYNYHPEITEHFIKDVGCGKKLFPSYTLKQFVDSLDRPRKIFLMIKAGDPVDEMINQLYPITEYGDLIIDGGN